MSLLRAFALSLPAVLLAACGAKQPSADDARVVRTTTVTADDGSSLILKEQQLSGRSTAW